MAKTILLADDSITIQKIVNLTFSGEGIEVVTVGNGDAAIKKVYDLHPDLVLADIFMPGKNGYEVCEYIKGQPEVQRTPVILLVGAFEPFDSNEAARVKADGHLTKPFEIKVLISAVNSLISATEENEEEKAEASIQVGVQLDKETSLPHVIEDFSSETKSRTPVVLMQDMGISESVGSGLQAEPLSPSPVSSFFADELPAREGPIVSLNQDQEQEAVLIDSEGPVDVVPAGAQIPSRAATGVEDLDPLGLYSSEPFAGVGREPAPEVVSDSKELVVDIWESRSSQPSRSEVLPDAGAQMPVPGPTIVVQEPVDFDSSVEMSRPAPIRLVDPTPAASVHPQPVASPPFSVGPVPSLPQRKDPVIATLEDSNQLVDQVVQRVMEKLSREVIEKIAWEVVPDLAEIIIKEQVETHFKASGRV